MLSGALRRASAMCPSCMGGAVLWINYAMTLSWPIAFCWLCPERRRSAYAIISRPIKKLYFVNRGLISLVHSMRDGRTVEVGTIGVEGLAGFPALFASAEQLSNALSKCRATRCVPALICSNPRRGEAGTSFPSFTGTITWLWPRSHKRPLATVALSGAALLPLASDRA